MEIHINNSTIGVVNTGTIQSLQLAMGDLNTSGHPDIAEAFQRLTEAAINDESADADARSELTERTKDLAEQASAKPSSRNLARIRSSVAGITALVSIVKDARPVWEQIYPLIQSHFGLG